MKRYSCRTPLFLAAILILAGSSLTAATRTWTGAVDSSLGNPANWGGTAPVNGDNLVFPSNGLNRSLSGGFPPPGLTVGSITVVGDYSLFSSQLTVTGGIQLDGDMSFVANFLGSQTIAGTPGSTMGLGLSPVIVPAGSTLTFSGPGASFFFHEDGSGSIVNASAHLVLDGEFSFNGPVFANGGDTEIIGLIGSAPAGPVQVSGPSTTLGLSRAAVGTVSVVNEGTLVIQGRPSTTSSLTLAGGTVLSLTLDPPQGTLSVTGTVALNGSNLLVDNNPPVPVGTVLTLIDNDGTDPVMGTFNGLPEGAIYVTSHSVGFPTEYFRVSYVGGTGNDVTLQAIGPAEVPTLSSFAMLGTALALAGIAVKRL